MRSGESRYRTGQAEPMEYPGTPLDQSSENCFLQGGVSKQALSRAPSMENTPLTCPRSVPIDKRGARQTSLDKLRLHGNTFESAFGGEQSLCK
jgi:hypothetical protein